MALAEGLTATGIGNTQGSFAKYDDNTEAALAADVLDQKISRMAKPWRPKVKSMVYEEEKLADQNGIQGSAELS